MFRIKENFLGYKIELELNDKCTMIESKSGYHERLLQKFFKEYSKKHDNVIVIDNIDSSNFAILLKEKQNCIFVVFYFDWLLTWNVFEKISHTDNTLIVFSNRLYPFNHKGYAKLYCYEHNKTICLEYPYKNFGLHL